MSTFALATLGCKVNSFESESYSQSLTDLGFEEVDFKQKADVYVINTCCVTNTAASKSRQRINQAQRLNPEALICVVGCYVQTHGSDLKADHGIDLLIGTGSKERLPELIRSALDGKTTDIPNISGEPLFEELNVVKFQHQTRAFLKIQDGCDQFCAYCIIPFARGRERSLMTRKVIEQARILSENHPEIVLAGIHTGRYGKEIGTDLTNLIEEMLASVPLLHRIRISSIEINEVSDALIALIKRESRIARHLHIPIQSGCDATLKRMKRPYTVDEFLRRIATIRREIPDISISTDLIVGFPQEVEAEFLTTLKTMEVAAFSFMHVFPYSKREGTAAASLEGQISPQCKKQRVQAAQLCSKDLNLKYRASFIGKQLSVIVEETDTHGGFGHSSEYIPVLLPKAQGIPPKSLVEVIVVDLQGNNLIGEINHDYAG
jgi:threonylcarbamoyladenosine tRNA methylthiotransferase MtaB